jgi:uncharacterized lipoprotein NlpE involved in copper resistance
VAEPTLPYTLTNGTTANASEVQANDQALLDAITDGTKDIEVAALTTTGACVFGNAAGDTVTFNGSIAATINVSANTSYDFGSSTAGMRSFYIGGSSTFTTRIIGGTQAGSLTITLPTTAGAAAQFLKTDGAGVTSWARPFSYATTAIDATLDSGTTHLDVDASGANRLITIPAASTALTGQTVWIRKTDTSFNTVTLQTGVSTTLNTLNEIVQIHCDGTAWVLLQRVIPSVWTSFTVGITGGSGNPTFHAGMTKAAYWRRVGDSIEMVMTLIQGSAGSSAGTGIYIFAPPTGVAFDTAKISAANNEVTTGLCGSAAANDAGSNYTGYCKVNSASGIVLIAGDASTTPTHISSTFIPATTAGIKYSFRATVPVSGWNG